MISTIQCSSLLNILKIPLYSIIHVSDKPVWVHDSYVCLTLEPSHSSSTLQYSPLKNQVS